LAELVRPGCGLRLARSAEALETAHKLDTIVLDKTGTITVGQPSLTDVRPAGPWGTDELLALAAAESDSEHPLGAAIVAGARERGLDPPVAAAFASVTGKGVQATVDGHTVLVGNSRLHADAGIATTALDPVAAELSADGKTPVLAAVDGRPAGVLAVSDPVKGDSAAAIAALDRLGVDVVMITGDSARTAAATARQVGVHRVLAEVLPGHKATEIRRLQTEGRTVGMTGDGINDAPALAADVGLAIGTGTDVAIEAADITLISGSLAGVVTAIELSRAAMRNIRQNLFFAMAYNAIGIPLAAGVLYPFFGIRLSPVIAAAAMALSSLSVVTNAGRLRRWHPAALPVAQPATVEPLVETGVGSADVTDPVCGMTVDPATAPEQRVTSSGAVWFCSAHCAATFDAAQHPEAPAAGQTGGTM
jgi:P-type Cu+ transporter